MKNNTIGVIVPELKHTFFAAILDGIEEIAFQHGYTIKVGQSKEDPKREIAEIKTLLSSGIEGLLISISQHTENSSHFRQIINRSIPLVFFDRVCQGLKASYVTVDDFEGAFKATEHLILSGYKRIAHLAGPQFIPNMKNRLNGYKAALEKYQMTFDQEIIVYGYLDEDSGHKGMKALLLLKKKPDAIFAVNDPVAIGALNQIKKASLNIRDDIGLVGFSDNPIAALLDPPLTTVAQPRYEIGITAAEILFEHINGKSELIEKVLKTKLIIRQSS